MQIDESNKPFSDSLGMGMAGVQKQAAFFASLGGITPWKLGMHQFWKQLSQWSETACLQSKKYLLPAWAAREVPAWYTSSS